MTLFEYADKIIETIAKDIGQDTSYWSLATKEKIKNDLFDILSDFSDSYEEKIEKLHSLLLPQ